MIPPPSRSTLFPYTTLFRSDRHRVCDADRVGDLDLAPVGEPCRALRGEERRRGRARRPEKAPPPDRKSTRLNSSHLGISYAVFCLKKKKNKQKKKNNNTVTH